MTKLLNGEPLDHPKYRADIDGLRAVAVLLVVGFHAFPSWVKGGFIGVDIFFVISGFLISSIIYGGLERGSFSFTVFYSRRIKRIFPALTLVLVATYGFGWFSLLTYEFVNLGKHIAGGAGFVSNFVLWNESGYFDTAAEAKPLLHLWSLGIEEQYYIIWPLLLWLGWKRRVNLLAIAIIVGVVSFALNIATVFSDPVAAFYAPQTRFWELLAGSILAYVTLYKPNVLALQNSSQFTIKSLVTIKSWLGPALILAAILLLDRERTFPGWWAMLPVAGAALIISAGPQGWFNRVILSNRLLVWFGLISFPLYLWHWPLLSFARIVEGKEPDPSLKIAAILAAIALAWLTYKLIEKPLRFGKKGKAITGLLVLVMMGVFVMGLLASKNIPQPKNNNPAIQRLVAALGDWEFPDNLKVYKGTDEKLYYLGGQKPDITLFWGDSHVQQYSPRIVRLLSDKKNRSNTVFFATSPGCPPIPGVFEDSDAHKDCNNARKAALDFIHNDKVKVVVIGACWNCYFIEQTEDSQSNRKTYDYYYLEKGIKHKFRNGGGAALALRELEILLKDLGRHKKLYLLLDNPGGPDFNPVTFITGDRLTDLHGEQMSQTAAISPRQSALRQQLINLARRIGVETIDPVDRLCKAGSCLRATKDGKPINSDKDHLRPFFVREKIDYLDKAVISGK